MKFWIAIILLAVSLAIKAQPESQHIELIDGKEYYIHTVQNGNTLWSIHSTYNVPVEDIIAANPGVEKGIKVGQKINVPVILSTIVHTVSDHETLYSISNKYNVPIERIKLANPNLTDELLSGQIVYIPGVYNLKLSTLSTEDTTQKSEDSITNKQMAYHLSFSDTVVFHTLGQTETLYSISKRYMVNIDNLLALNQLKNSKVKPGQVIKIPVKQEKMQIVLIRKVEDSESNQTENVKQFSKKPIYKIMLLLPFQLDKSDKEANHSDYLSTLATEFYMGTKLAMDSLEKMGLNAKLYVFDSKNDTNSLKLVLEKPEIQDVDFVFGPLNHESIEITAKWCKLHEARLICPVVSKTSVLKENPYVYYTVPSDLTLIKGLANYTLRSNSKDQLVIIKSNNEKDKIIYEGFRDFFHTPQNTHPKLIEAGIDNFTTFLKKGVRNVLIFPTNDKLLAVKFMNNLNRVAANYTNEMISVYATKEWMNFEEIKPGFKNTYHFHFASPNDLNYKYQQTEKLHYKYRSAYNSDMTKMAVQGFDVVFHFCSAFMLGITPEKMIMNEFQMTQKGKNNGYENEHAYILEMLDYELLNVNFK